MEKKRITDDLELGPTPSPKAVDRFGFFKQEQSNSPEGITKSRSTREKEKYEFLLYFIPFYAHLSSLYTYNAGIFLFLG